MSQNRTIVPGESLGSFEMPKEMDMSFYDQLYRQSPSEAQGRTIESTKTVVSDRPVACGMPEQTGRTGVITRTTRDIRLQDRMVVGILFSVSRNGLGEMFPVYLGRNRIGSNPINDICLREQTVADEHAILHVIRDSLDGERLEVSLTDYGSQGATVVGNKDVMFEPVMVSDGDIIAIGTHYRFVIRIFDMKNLGLYEDPSFMSLEVNPGTSFQEAAHNPVGDTPVPNSAYNDFSALDDIYSSDSDFSGSTSKTVLI